MNQKVLEILATGKSFSIKDIKIILGISNENELIKVLTDLENRLEIYKSNKNKYILFQNSNLKKGILHIVKNGTGFVDIGLDKDIYINSNNTKDAIDGDVVAVEIINAAKNEGKISKIASRENRIFIGEIVIKKNKVYVKLDGDNSINVVLTNNNLNLVDGTKIALTLKNKVNDTYIADVKEILGHKNDPGIDLLTIVKKHNIEVDFPNEVLEEIKNIPNSLSEEEINKELRNGFRDLRNEKVFTIDGDDTKDIDDAVSIKILDNGNYQLSIHIADVSYYVKPETNMFINAINRGTSIYMPGSCIPMLSRELSNGICSLNPNVDRFALTFQMEISKSGELKEFDVFESIINSKKQMTYSKVNQILEENIIPEGYENFKDDLFIMNKLANILRKNRIKRGFIDFNISENKIEVDNIGQVSDIKLRKRGASEKLIEDFMVETGENASKYLDLYNIPHVYRIHGEPKQDKIIGIKKFLSSLGYKSDRIDEFNPCAIQKFLEEISNQKDYLIISRELLKCMQKAYYSSNNIGHFALASESICQVTSPIRRAGDLVNHVLIKENIYQKKNNSIIHSNLQKMCGIASSTERIAASIEQDANNMKMAEYMENHIGEEFEGTITEINKLGIYVELPNLVKGFINKETLIDDNYTFDREKHCFIGKTSHHKYSLGDRVNIKVCNADKSKREIDFLLVNDKEKKKKVLMQNKYS